MKKKILGIFVCMLLITTSNVILVIGQPPPPPEHDVGVSDIISPFSGCFQTYPVNVKVKNYGSYEETTDVQVNIFKCEAGPLLFEENFDNDIPSDWDTNYWVESNTNKAGGTSHEAHYGYYPGQYNSYGWIMTPPIDCTGYKYVNVKFRLYGDFYDPYSSDFYVQYRKNAISPWCDVSPWDNPVSGDLGPGLYEIGCCGCGEDLGDAFQLRWYFDSGYWCLQLNSGIYLDDVEVEGCACCAEWAELVEDVVVPYDSEVTVVFPDWTPSDCGEYCVTAFTLLDDDVPGNDCKTVDITVACTLEEIINRINDLIQDVYDTGKPFRHGLITKLNGAIDKLQEDPPDISTAIDKIEAFINQVEGLRGLQNGLTNSEADAFVDEANYIIWLLNNCLK